MRKPDFPGAVLRYVFTVAWILIAAQAKAAAQTIEIDPAKPSDHWLAAGVTMLAVPDFAQGLAGVAPEKYLGWAAYDFSADDGWYRLRIQADGDISHARIKIDDEETVLGTVMEAGYDFGWVRLGPGAHRLKIEDYWWTGLPRVTAIALTPARSSDEPFSVEMADPGPFFVGSCGKLTIKGGGAGRAYIVRTDFGSGIGFPAADTIERTVEPPCGSVGDREVTLSAGGYVWSENYAVFAVDGPVRPEFVDGKTVATIDAVAQAPDFGGRGSVVSSGAGSFRKAGSYGETSYLRRHQLPPRPSWFAYRIGGLTPGRAYSIEIEYPDDARRAFTVAVRDPAMDSYMAAVAVETGGLRPTSGGMRTRRAMFWTSTPEARVVVFTVHDGMNAAVKNIRIAEAERREAPAPARAPDARNVTIWSEEGNNFRYPVGVPSGQGHMYEAVNRFLSLVAASGADTVSPTAVIYDTAMYPSSFNLAFSDRRIDLLKGFMLGARRYGLRVVPQLHPRADELLWSGRTDVLSLSSSGERHLYDADGRIERPPYFDPTDPEVRKWYVAMIGELADRYARYPAFAGIDLRQSEWVDAGLNNFVSLDWGYGAATVARFYRDTGIRPPLDTASDDATGAAARYAELTGGLRVQWIAWRCDKIAELYREVVARVRQARPDLKVYSSLFAMSQDGQPGEKLLREAGIDPRLLGSIDGLELIDALRAYGAKEADSGWQRRNAPETATVADYAPFLRTDGGLNLMMPMQYFEIPPETTPPAPDLGLPAPPGDEPWVSAASQPPPPYPAQRYAAALATTDVFMFGDGGNGYVFGDRETAAFLRAFSMLPKSRFDRVDGTGPVVVRTRQGMFYAVGTGPEAARVSVRLDRPSEARDMTTGEQIEGEPKDRIEISIPPFGLKVVALSRDTRAVGAAAINDLH